MYICPSRSIVRHAPYLSVTVLCPSCSNVRHAPLSVTLNCPSRSFVRHAQLSVTLLCPSRSSTRARKDGGGVTHVYTRSSSRVGWMDGWMDGWMVEVRESTPDQTPGPSRARWMEGGGTVRLHHQRQLGLLTARGICMRTLRIPSYPMYTLKVGQTLQWRPVCSSKPCVCVCVCVCRWSSK